MPAHVRGVT